MRILQHNLNHCEAAHDLMTQLVREMKIDLVIIADPYIRPKTQAWITDVTGKAAVWSCNGRPFEDQPDSTQRGFVRVKLGGVHFYSVYAPPSLNTGEFTDLLDSLVKDAKEHFPSVIAGDFNAWAVEWGSKKTNERGNETLQAMSFLDMVLLNTGTLPTFERDSGSSFVDLTLVSPSLARGGNDWTVHDIFNMSDHRLLSFVVMSEQAMKRPLRKRMNFKGWNASKFDAELFQEAFNSEPIAGNNAQDEADEAMRRVAVACDATMTRKRPRNDHPPMYWWNNDIANSRQEVIRARRGATRGRKKPNYSDLKESYKVARLKLVKAIKSSKAQCWQELVKEAEHDPWGRPYKVVMKRVKPQPLASPTCPVLLEKIVTNLFPRQPELQIGDFGTDEPIPPITLEELKTACSRLRNKKAPGPDGIPNIALKRAINIAPEMFLHMYNRCVQEGHFPTKWKLQRLVLLLKGKKPPDEPSAYRPLCMLDSAGKILERIMYTRIEVIVEKQLPDRQYGFRRGRSTIDAINLVVNTAKDAITGDRWKNGEKKYCAVVTLDMQNAFNSARWDRIIEALDQYDIPKYLQKLVVSYFTDRLLQYDTDDGSKVYKVSGEVPQGSVLGPLLWIVMYNGLLKLRIPRMVMPVAFADDVALVIVGKFLVDIKNLFNVTFRKYADWMNEAGLKMAMHKTEVTLITSRKERETITLQVGEHEVESKPSVRYLGVMIDARLNFKDQVEHACSGAAAVGGALSRLMPNVGGPKAGRRALLASVVTSILTYGIAIWAGALELQECQRRIYPIGRQLALRITSAFRTVSRDAAHVISGLLPIEILAEEYSRRYQRRTQGLVEADDSRTREREKSLQRWQAKWDSSEKGRWTHQLIPQIAEWTNRQHGDPNYYLTQLLTGHGCFRQYLYKYKYEDSPECPVCHGVEEDARHVFFTCPRFDLQRRELERVTDVAITPENLVQQMLVSEAAWSAATDFAREVIKELRNEEKRRKEHPATREYATHASQEAGRGRRR